MKIKLIEISKSYGLKEIFNQQNITIHTGEFLGIKGESGSGKTTLLNIIGGIEPMDGGQRLINKEDYTNCTSKRQRQLFTNYVSFIFQHFGLIQNETIYQNLTYVLSVKKVPKRRHREIINSALQQVNLEYVNKEAKIFSLSGGEQQRVAICRAILSDNPIILADEPCGSLDAKNSQLIMDLFKALNKKGKTIIIVTHDDQFDSVFSRIMYLS